MNIQQRAKRATTRKNNKLAKKYPLFAEQLAITIESQMERLEKQEITNERYFEKLRQAQQAAYQRGVEYRAVVEQLARQGDFGDYDKRYQRIYGNRSMERSGSEFADWWWQAAKELIPTWAQEHCPNAHFHEWEMYQAEGECPTCKARLNAPDIKDSPHQLSFIKQRPP